MISTDRSTGYSRVEPEESYSVRSLTSLEVEWEPSYEGLKVADCQIERGQIGARLSSTPGENDVTSSRTIAPQWMCVKNMFGCLSRSTESFKQERARNSLHTFDFVSRIIVYYGPWVITNRFNNCHSRHCNSSTSIFVAAHKLEKRRLRRFEKCKLFGKVHFF